MHPAAREWDKKYKYDVRHNEPHKGKILPVNRPCDWCGEPVKRGYIHKKACLKLERNFWLDVFN